MRSPLRERLATGRPLLVDGATGTQLQARGLPPGAPGELWVLEQPDAVREVAAAYVAAGSDIVYTNTFGGNRWRLAAHGLSDDLETINRRAAELAREAAGDERYVGGSMGPTGDFLHPLGPLDPAAVEAAYATQAAALVAGGVDLLVLETFSALDELTAALLGARSVGDVPVLCSLTYGPGGRTMMGVAADAAAASLVDAGAELIGLNCGDNLDVVEPVLTAYAATCPELPRLAKPNAGLPEIVGGQPVWPLGPEAFAHRARGWLAAGAKLLGGCCGTTPAHVAALRALLDEG